MLLRVFVCQNCSPDYIFVVFSSSFTFHFCCNAKKSRACARLFFVAYVAYFTNGIFRLC